MVAASGDAMDGGGSERLRWGRRWWPRALTTKEARWECRWWPVASGLARLVDDGGRPRTHRAMHRHRRPRPRWGRGGQDARRRPSLHSHRRPPVFFSEAQRRLGRTTRECRAALAGCDLAHSLEGRQGELGRCLWRQDEHLPEDAPGQAPLMSTSGPQAPPPPPRCSQTPSPSSSAAASTPRPPRPEPRPMHTGERPWPSTSSVHICTSSR